MPGGTPLIRTTAEEKEEEEKEGEEGGGGKGGGGRGGGKEERTVLQSIYPGRAADAIARVRARTRERALVRVTRGPRVWNAMLFEAGFGSYPVTLARGRESVVADDAPRTQKVTAQKLLTAPVNYAGHDRSANCLRVT
mmetsp:Transcript_27202/g.72551  ORF Transcript_27202/g.72551 Transcript_27202/m.72551 type:complete len:138 (-) Transcript_27202:914-1327(-)